MEYVKKSDKVFRNMTQC